MGYYTRVDGEIVITPPLTATEMSEVGIKPLTGWPRDRWIAVRERHGREVEMDIAVRINVAEHANDERLLIKTHTGVALVPSWDDEYKAYSTKEDLQTLINSFPGHEFTGEMRMEGEDNLDVWKLQVKDNVVEAIYPTLVWPDGSEETYRR
jgi:hypothetical protein